MFPNDDICNIQAAKGAAQRLFRKYKNLAQKQQPILGKQEVGKLMKDTYQAINMPYNPNEEDVFSFISVFDSNNDGKIQLKDFQEMAVKYLCGTQTLLGSENSGKKVEEVKEEKTKSEYKQARQQSEKKSQFNESHQNKQQHYKSLFIEKLKPLQTVSSPKVSKIQPNKQFFPASHLTPRSKASQKQSALSTNLSQQPNKNPKINELVNKGRQLFLKHVGSFKGITQSSASKLITATYELINKKNFMASEEDVKIWIKLCDRNKDGIVEWQDYEYFLIRIYQRSQGESIHK